MPEWESAYSTLASGDTGYSEGIVYMRPANLDITKKVSNAPSSGTAATFSITLTLATKVTGTVTYGGVEFVNGSHTWTGVTNGWTVGLKELPPTAYTITEPESDMPAHYTLKGVTTSDNGTLHPHLDGRTDPDTALVINEYKPEPLRPGFTNRVPQVGTMPETGKLGVMPFILLALVVFVGGAWLAFGRRK